MARRLARGEFVRPGVHPPEIVGREPGCFGAVRADLEARGVRLAESVESL
jgi:hypothetical protein